MKYLESKKIIILGIGGRGAYYIAQYLKLLGLDVYGYDIKKGERSDELEKMGIKIEYRNPDKGEKLDCDMYLYSNDLPKVLQDQIFEDNEGIERMEIGRFYHQLVDEYEVGKMDSTRIDAFKKSNIAPLFDIDTSKMKYISVTGTDGKTTTCSMIFHILKDCGFKPALITTVAAYIGDEKLDTGLHTTTPSSQELYSLIRKIEENDCTHIVIESTSHGLEQGRLAGLKFDVVGYTNITSEHLDYHGDWFSYCNAKSLLIRDHLKDDGVVVLNKDDKSYDVLSKLVSNFITYSLDGDSDILGLDISESVQGISFDLFKEDTKSPVYIPILGRYNVSNFLCSLGICSSIGLSVKQVVDSIGGFETVKGRMEIVKREPYTVIVDYAHTSNALENALESAKLLVKGDGKLIHIFGCAGRRDFYKRPEMGKISNELADVTILTAEDPRLEDLKNINDEIEKGWREGSNKEGVLLRYDYMDKDVQVRRDAISKGIELANEGDVVIVTGKAHEESLCFGQIEYPWNDIEEVKKILNT